MMTTIEKRLKSLRDVAFQEEQDYHQLILAEKDINVSTNHSGNVSTQDNPNVSTL